MKIVRNGVEIELTQNELLTAHNEWIYKTTEKYPNSMLRVETPLGVIIAGAIYDENYPGVWIDLRRKDAGYDVPLAVVECAPVKDEQGPELVTHVWGNAMQEDATTRVVHERIEDFFRMEELY